MNQEEVAFDALRTLSSRGGMAWALACLEAVTRENHLDGERWRDWLERAWRLTSAPRTQWAEVSWPRNFDEIDALFTPPVGGWGNGLSDLLRRVFEHAKETHACILANEALDEPLRALVRELHSERIPLPDIEAFARSSRRQMGGLGRSVPPGFFRERVEREEFYTHLSAKLRSPSVHDRRAAAFASAHLGLGSDVLLEALIICADTDADEESRLLALTALAVLATAEEQGRIRQRLDPRPARQPTEPAPVAPRVTATSTRVRSPQISVRAPERPTEQPDPATAAVDRLRALLAPADVLRAELFHLTSFRAGALCVIEELLRREGASRADLMGLVFHDRLVPLQLVFALWDAIPALPADRRDEAVKLRDEILERLKPR